MRREYLAMCDNGHDYLEFRFYSEHRRNSKANLQDAKDALRRQYGNAVYRSNRIISVEKID